MAIIKNNIGRKAINLLPSRFKFCLVGGLLNKNRIGTACKNFLRKHYYLTNEYCCERPIVAEMKEVA